jgi:ADP-ribose pyrophosphatase YjhB (NUDIX family)
MYQLLEARPLVVLLFAILLSMIRKLYAVLHTIRKFYWRTFNIKTYGVRVLVPKSDEVLLVYHRYGDLWVFPGGGIKKDEDIHNAAYREVKEETNIAIHSFERKLGVYKNTQEGKNDTVTILVAKKWEAGPIKKFNLEISKMQFFKFNNLPEQTSQATRRRIGEYLSGEKREFNGWW